MRVTKFLRIRVLATGRDRLWARGRSWYGVSLIGGTSCASTWYSFLSTDAKRISSAVPHITANEGELRGKNPNLCNLDSVQGILLFRQLQFPVHPILQPHFTNFIIASGAGGCKHRTGSNRFVVASNVQSNSVRDGRQGWLSLALIQIMTI